MTILACTYFGLIEKEFVFKFPSFFLSLDLYFYKLIQRRVGTLSVYSVKWMALPLRFIYIYNILE